MFLMQQHIELTQLVHCGLSYHNVVHMNYVWGDNHYLIKICPTNSKNAKLNELYEQFHKIVVKPVLLSLDYVAQNLSLLGCGHYL